MIEIGLTGNISSGKTTVSKIFEALGIPIFYSDVQAKQLYYRDDVKKNIMEVLGSSVFNNTNEIDYKKLALVIFNDSEALEFINKLIHPLVFDAYRKWQGSLKNTPYVIHESAILFEHQLQKRFDKTIVVYCPEAIRIKRAFARDSVSLDEIKSRISNQMSDTLKNKLADLIIVNDGTKMLIPQVMKVHETLTKEISE